jgi:hypothetical protein
MTVQLQTDIISVIPRPNDSSLSSLPRFLSPSMPPQSTYSHYRSTFDLKNLLRSVLKAFTLPFLLALLEIVFIIHFININKLEDFQACS